MTCSILENVMVLISLDEGALAPYSLYQFHDAAGDLGNVSGTTL